MKVGIVGLGLIGGSFAKAYHAAGWEVLAADIDRQMLDFAMLQGAVNGELTEDAQADCDLILIAVYPRAAVEYLQKHGKYATATMYHGAPMVLVPADHNNIELLSRVKELLSPAGFGRFSVTTAEKHDEMIAFTSQMAHVVSNAYIKSPTAGSHKGFSAGSYKDLTRVAWLNPQMWAELFLEN